MGLVMFIRWLVVVEKILEGKMSLNFVPRKNCLLNTWIKVEEREKDVI